MVISYHKVFDMASVTLYQDDIIFDDSTMNITPK
jgi:hypothetical protein